MTNGDLSFDSIPDAIEAFGETNPHNHMSKAVLTHEQRVENS